MSTPGERSFEAFLQFWMAKKLQNRSLMLVDFQFAPVLDVFLGGEEVSFAIGMQCGMNVFYSNFGHVLKFVL